MLRIKDKIKFKHSENIMKQVGDVEQSLNRLNLNKNLYSLLDERFKWMNSFINENDKGIEVGAAAGYSKKFIKSKNFKISDYKSQPFRF